MLILICIFLKCKRQTFYIEKPRFEMDENIENPHIKHPLSQDWVFITELPENQLFQHLKALNTK